VSSAANTAVIAAEFDGYFFSNYKWLQRDGLPDTEDGSAGQKTPLVPKEQGPACCQGQEFLSASLGRSRG